jgi:cytochrome c oxidase assembly factor CtaG
MPIPLHPGLPPAPHDLWRAWNWSPPLLLGLGLALALHALGSRALWERGARGRGGVLWHAAAFAGGVAALGIALISPLDALGAALLAGHMAQHTLLTLVAAPLLVLGAPLAALAWSLPRRWRRALGRRRPAWLRAAWGQLTGTPAALALHSAVLWLWHMPALYEAALASPALHALEHACLLGTGLLFWWAILGARRRSAAGALALLIMAIQSSLLSALLLAARQPWYPSYAQSSPAWGTTALEDQQLAALIMMLPCDLAYLAAALWISAAWLTDRNAVYQAGLAE